MDTPPAPLAGALDWARAQLCGPEARLEAEVLLAHCLQVNRSYLYTWPERELDAAQRQRYAGLIAQRRQGEPVAYLLGEQEFWSLSLRVTPATLIPRPETELLVEQVLQHVGSDGAPQLLDLGTGSGAIALALASELPRAQVVGVDCSAQALAVAEDNRCRLGLHNVELRLGDWFTPVAGERFDAIAANPPYIGADEPEPDQGDCRFEPRGALIAAEAGLADLRCISDHAAAHLKPGGLLALEHGYRQGAAVRALLEQAGFARVATLRDLAGHERLTLGYAPERTPAG